MAAFRAKHPVLLFFLAAYGFSWLIWLPLVADTAGWIRVPWSHFHMQQIGAFGPSLMAVLIAGQGRKGLLKSAIHWRVHPGLYLVALVGPAAYMVAGRSLHSLMGGALAPNPAVSTGVIITTFIFQLLYGGPLAEELGWRGYALPRMQARMGFWGASCTLGAVWALWHLPLFFVRGSAQYGTSFIGFLLTGVGLSVLIGWVFNAARGSVLLTLLTHAGVNTAASFILIAPAGGQNNGPFFWTLALVGVTILVSAVRTRISRRKLAA